MFMFFFPLFAKQPLYILLVNQTNLLLSYIQVNSKQDLATEN
jgi:hypothetical protein